MIRGGGRTLHIGRRHALLLTIAAACCALAWLWDWNWFRGPVQHYLSDRAGRPVELGHLDISFSGLDPTVHVGPVAIDNAPWVQGTRGEPLAVARYAAFTLDWRSVFAERLTVQRLVLADAAIHLERRADGLRNWRLADPTDTGPPKARILRVEAQRSTLHFVNEGLALDLHAAASDLPAAVDRPGDEALTTRWRFEGRFRQSAFTAEAQTSRVLTFFGTGEPFAVDGQATAGPLRLQLAGRATDIFEFGGMEADLRLSGRSLADLRALLTPGWPDTAAFTATGHLSKAGPQWRFDAVRATVGRSDAAGEGVYTQGARDSQGEARDQLAVKATSDAVHLPDLSRRGGAAGAGRRNPPAFDAQVAWEMKALHVPVLPPLSNVRTTARLADGALEVSLASARLAEGSLQGLLAYDMRQQPQAARADLSWRDLRLERLLPPRDDGSEASGPVSGMLKITSRGASWQDWLAHADGQARLHLASGLLSANLDAKLALNGGKMLRAAVTQADKVPVRCARVDIALHEGIGQLSPLVLDTAQTRIEGRGIADLRRRRIDVTLTPEPKQTALLALRRSMHVTGTFDAPEVKLVAAEAFGRSSCDPVSPAASR